MTAKRYRKKPVVIDAMQSPDMPPDAPGMDDLLNGLAAWCGGERTGEYGRLIMIETLEGAMFASPGDYVIKGVQGEFYPCKPDIFRATYDAV